LKARHLNPQALKARALKARSLKAGAANPKALNRIHRAGIDLIPDTNRGYKSGWNVPAAATLHSSNTARRRACGDVAAALQMRAIGPVVWGAGAPCVAERGMVRRTTQPSFKCAIL
jgi:hypothetical protein